jgi:flagellar biosynthesis GTPase FlhF
MEQITQLSVVWTKLCLPSGNLLISTPRSKLNLLKELKQLYMAIKKNDFSSIQKKFSAEASFKPDRYFDLGNAFTDACGIPGPVMGHLNMLLGHTDTGKTTGLIKTAIDAQKKGILPVFIITEQNGIGIMRF